VSVGLHGLRSHGPVKDDMHIKLLENKICSKENSIHGKTGFYRNENSTYNFSRPQLTGT